MASYDGITSDVQGMIFLDKYDNDTNAVQKTLNKYQLDIKATPKAGQSVQHTWQHAMPWKNEAYGKDIKSKTKFAFAIEDWKMAMTPANDKWNFEVAKPLATDDVKADGKLAIEGKPSKSLKFDLSAAIKLPEASGVKTGMNVKLTQEMESADGKADFVSKDPKVVFDMAAQVEKDYQAGFKVETDLKALKKASVAVAMLDGDAKHYGGYDHCASFVKIGSKQKHDDWTHAYEARYSLKAGSEGTLAGLPITVATGGKVAYSKSTSMAYGLEWTKSMHAQMQWAHKVDKNWSVAMHQSFDMNRLGSKREPYDIAFAATYTL